MYNDGREYDGRDNCHELAGVHGYFKDYYSYEFSIDNVNIERQLLVLSTFAIILLPWVIWLMRKRYFTMTWWRWLLLLSTICAVSLKLVIELWKYINYGWYDIGMGDGPTWWVAFECIGVVGYVICFLFSGSWILYEFIKNFQFIVRKKERSDRN